MSGEPWIERVIREAQEAGKLDVTEGAGRPIPGLSRPYDPARWARNWIDADRARERSADLAREIQQELPRLLSKTDDDVVRAGLELLNSRISQHNDTASRNALPLLDVEQLLKERAERHG